MLTDKITLFEGEHIEDLGDGVGVVVSKQHTFGTDAMLLAAFANPKRNDIACDFGSGCGIIPFLWLRDKSVHRLLLWKFRKQAVIRCAVRWSLTKPTKLLFSTEI